MCPTSATVQVFAIKLSPPELGAAIHAFDKDGDGLVSCPEFLLTFFRLGEELSQYVRSLGPLLEALYV